MSLRDQFLKAGIASKKQAKKAANDARLEKKKNTGKDIEISKKIAADLAKRKEKDRLINQQRELEKQQIEKKFQARQILLRNSIICREDPELNTYYFLINEKKIKGIKVTEQQQTQLTVGDLGIVCTEGTNTHFALLPRTHCQRVLDLDPGPVICLHSQLKDLPQEEDYDNDR